MKYPIFFLFLLWLIPASASDLLWQSDYQAGLTQAGREGKPILLDFSAPWCTWCRFLDQTTFQDNAVKNSLSSYLLVRIDYDKATDLVAHFGVKGIPALFLLNRFGETVATQEGYADPRAFYDWLTRNDKAAKATRSTRQDETEKLKIVTAQISQVEPAQQAQLIDQIIEVALHQNKEAAKPALVTLQSLIQQNPLALLPKLNDRSLAVRILFASLYEEKLGPNFQFDPWETTEARAAIVANWTGKLSQSPVLTPVK